MKENIAYLNAEVFGAPGKSAQDSGDDSEDETGDEMQNLLEGLALDEDEDDEAPPTVDIPSPPRDLTEAAPRSRANSPLGHLSRTPLPDPPATAIVAASSSTRRAAETADVPLATPPALKAAAKKGKKSRPAGVPEGTLPDAVPARITRRNKA